MKYNFTAEDIQKAEEFSNKIDVNYYSGRNQFDVQKKRLDQKVGKLGELAVYGVLKDKLTNITEPDFNIYEAKDKSWDFDIKADNVNLHVKSQLITQANLFGESWIFQYGNGKTRHYDKEIFDRTSPNQYIGFAVINLASKSAEVKAVISLDFLHEKKLFKMPVKESLKQANKLAVYYADLEKHPDNLWQL